VILSEAVIATPALSDHAPGFSVTGISPCPRATYINYHNLNPRDDSEGGNLLMEDGRYQEMQVLDQLKRTGFQLSYIGDEQLEVHVGEAKVPGHPDGFITVPSYKLGMLEIKAMNLTRFNRFRYKGLEPRIKCQVQLYMSCLDFVDFTWVYAKSRETCRPHDRIEEKDIAYTKPIVQATDEIILGGWIPDPELTDYCTTCRHAEYCWKAPVLDNTDTPDIIDAPALVEKWLHGKMQRDLGKEEYEDARALLLHYLPEGQDSAIIEAVIEDLPVALELKRITSERFTFSKHRFIDQYGAQNLHKVMDFEEVTSIRTRELTNWY